MPNVISPFPKASYSLAELCLHACTMTLPSLIYLVRLCVTLTTAITMMTLRITYSAILTFFRQERRRWYINKFCSLSSPKRFSKGVSQTCKVQRMQRSLCGNSCAVYRRMEVTAIPFIRNYTLIHLQLIMRSYAGNTPPRIYYIQKLLSYHENVAAQVFTIRFRRTYGAVLRGVIFIRHMHPYVVLTRFKNRNLVTSALDSTLSNFILNLALGHRWTTLLSCRSMCYPISMYATKPILHRKEA